MLQNQHPPLLFISDRMQLEWPELHRAPLWLFETAICFSADGQTLSLVLDMWPIGTAFTLTLLKICSRWHSSWDSFIITIHKDNLGDIDDHHFSLLFLASGDNDNVDNDGDDDRDSKNNDGKDDDGYIACPLSTLLLASNDSDFAGNDGDDIEDNDVDNDGYIAHQLSFLLLSSGRRVCLVVQLCQSWTSSLMGEEVALQMLRDCLVSKLLQYNLF